MGEIHRLTNSGDKDELLGFRESFEMFSMASSLLNFYRNVELRFVDIESERRMTEMGVKENKQNAMARRCHPPPLLVHHSVLTRVSDARQ